MATTNLQGTVDSSGAMIVTFTGGLAGTLKGGSNSAGIFAAVFDSTGSLTGAPGPAGPTGPAGPSVWGGISGTLASQTDLQSALDAKQASDSDLTAIAAIASTGAGALAMDVAGGWIKKTWAQVTALVFGTAASLDNAGNLALGVMGSIDGAVRFNSSASSANRYATIKQVPATYTIAGYGTGSAFVIGQGVGLDTVIAPTYRSYWLAAGGAWAQGIWLGTQATMTAAAGLQFLHISPDISNATGAASAVSITANWAQTGTSSATDLLINSGGTYGSGGHLLCDLQQAGVSMFSVSPVGNVHIVGNVGIGSTTTAYKLYVSDTANNSNAAITALKAVTDPTATLIGMSSAVTQNATSNNANSAYGLTFAVYTGADAFNRTGSIFGLQGFCYHYGTGTLTSAQGAKVGVRMSANSPGTITTVHGLDIYSGISTGNSGTITYNYDLFLNTPLLGTGGTIVNDYGLYIGNRSGTTTNYSIYTGTAQSYFGGKIGVGITPTASLHIKAGTATANTAPLKLTAGVNLTTPEDGALEYSGGSLYFTTGTTRTALGGTSSAANRFIISLSDDTISTKFDATTKRVLGRKYIDPTAAWGTSGTSTATLHMILETTNGAISVQGDLYQQTGTGSPATIASTPTTVGTTATDVNVDVSAAFRPTGHAGIYAVRVWITTANGTDQATCSGCWIEVQP